MSWTHHVDENERLHLECKAIDDLARLVRIGFLAGLCAPEIRPTNPRDFDRSASQ